MTLGVARGPSSGPNGSRSLESELLETEAREGGIGWEDLPVFEELDPATPRASEPLLAQALNPDSALAESFRVLRTKVRTLQEVRPLRTIGIVSAMAGEGKTSVALGLAAALSWERSRRVLVLEGDVRARSIERRLGLGPTPGLVEWLQDRSASVPVRRLGRSGPYLLSAGIARLEEMELLGSARMSLLLASCSRTFDWVVVDSAPLLPVADAVLLQDLLDGFLCVVRAYFTPRDTLHRAMANIKSDRIRGVVLNDYREILTSYYRPAYRRYSR
jgi:Mrp family chromosome partitioning ATPase